MITCNYGGDEECVEVRIRLFKETFGESDFEELGQLAIDAFPSNACVDIFHWDADLKEAYVWNN